MILMMDFNAKIFKLFDEEFDFVLLRIPPHIAKLFVFIASNNFVNSSGYSISNSYLGLVG